MTGTAGGMRRKSQNGRRIKRDLQPVDNRLVAFNLQAAADFLRGFHVINDLLIFCPPPTA